MVFATTLRPLPLYVILLHHAAGLGVDTGRLANVTLYRPSCRRDDEEKHVAYVSLMIDRCRSMIAAQAGFTFDQTLLDVDQHAQN